MKKPLLSTIISVLQLAVLLLLLYPVLQLLSTLIRIDYLPYVWQNLALAELCGMLAFALSSNGVKERLHLSETTLRIVKTAFMLVSAALTFVMNSVLLKAGIVVVLISVVAVVGTVIFADSYRKRLLKIFDVLVICAIYLATAFVLHLFDVPYSLNAFVWLLVITALVLALSMNYSNIDRLMTRRGHSMERLPIKIRWHNILLVVSISVVIILLVVFRSFFAGLLGDFFGLVKNGLTALLPILSKILFFWDKGDPEGYDPSLELPDPSEYPETSGSVMDLVIEADGAGTALSQIFLMLFVFGLVIGGIIFLFVGPFGGAIRDFFKRLGGMLRRRVRVEENEYYVDVMEDIADTGKNINNQLELSTERKWRRKLRRYRRMPEGREKFLRGYELSIEGLMLRGAEIPASKTPLEILEISRPLLPVDGYAVATDCMNAIRYGEKDIVPSLAELDEILNTIRMKKK